MSEPKTDRLGRATFHYIRPDDYVRPTDRDRRWFQHIARHGPQSSVYLYETSRDTHRCRDTALRRLQQLRAGGYLSLPPQQRATERAECKPYAYDITRRAEDHLKGRDLWDCNVRPSGHWWHTYLTSQVTSSIDICAVRAGVRFIPAHEILGIKEATLAIPHGRRAKLIPDQLFALDYGGRFRAFALEVDRGTEPKTSPANRKSWARSIGQYDQVLTRGTHKAHYGIHANLLVLWVFTTQTKAQSFLELVRKLRPKYEAAFLVQTLPERQATGSGFSLLSQLWREHWARVDAAGLRIDRG